jgi:hypothetical protein
MSCETLAYPLGHGIWLMMKHQAPLASAVLSGGIPSIRSKCTEPVTSDGDEQWISRSGQRSKVPVAMKYGKLASPRRRGRQQARA